MIFQLSSFRFSSLHFQLQQEVVSGEHKVSEELVNVNNDDISICCCGLSLSGCLSYNF